MVKYRGWISTNGRHGGNPITENRGRLVTCARPNILLIMGDEHAPMAGATWGGAAQTPYLDQLAEEGVTFDAAYCNSPLCVPSRMSMLTGQFAHRVEAFDLASPLSSATPTIAHALRAGGYDAVLAGKQHFVGPDQLHGFRTQLATDAHAGLNPLRPWPDDGQSPAWRHPLEAGPGRTRYTDIDDEVETAALAYMAEQRLSNEPWFLCASFIAPHWPYIVPQEYWDRYPVEATKVPLVSGAELAAQHPVIQQLRRSLGVDAYSEEATRRARTAYLGAITHLDDRIGRLLAGLEATGCAASTLVVYVADHGGMLGEHGLWRKMNFYEESVRIPMIMRWPGVLPRRKRVADPVSLVDLVPTLVSIAGVPPLHPADGQDLLPVVQGRLRARATVFSEYLGHGISAPMAMLRRGRWKLNYYHGADPQLFDLIEDPHELTDLAASSPARDLIGTLFEQLLADWNPDALDARVRHSQSQRMLIRQSQAQGDPSHDATTAPYTRTPPCAPS